MSQSLSVAGRSPLLATSPSLSQRLESIDWQLKPERFRSHAALLKEFLRRSALWADQLDCGPEQSPLVDWVELVGTTEPARTAELRLPRPALPDIPNLPELRRLLASPHALVVQMVRYALRWEASTNWEPLQHFRRHLPEPYEPLIRLLERGGPFWAEGGFLRVGPVGVVLRTWRLRVADAPLRLDDESLDRIDDNQPELPTFL